MSKTSTETPEGQKAEPKMYLPLWVRLGKLIGRRYALIGIFGTLDFYRIYPGPAGDMFVHTYWYKPVAHSAVEYFKEV